MGLPSPFYKISTAGGNFPEERLNLREWYLSNETTILLNYFVAAETQSEKELCKISEILPIMTSRFWILLAE